MTEAQWLSLAVCVAISICHLSAMRLWVRLRGQGPQVASFSGGAAAAYVFLHLIPELENTHVTVGERIHGVVLVGFVFLFTVDTLVSSFKGGEHGRQRFRIRIGLSALYNALLAFTMSEQLPLSPLTAVAYALALGLHVTMVDLTLIDAFGPGRHRVGRYVLAAATMLGWLLSLLTNPPEVALDVLTALMAGFIIFTVFGEELPKRRGVRLAWFTMGAFVYFMLELVSKV